MWEQLAPFGEDRSEVTSNGLVLRYGSSLRLIAACSGLLIEEFDKIDAEEDWKEHEKNQRQQLFVVVEKPKANSDAAAAPTLVCGEPLAALRFILDASCDDGRLRAIIDNVYTIPDARGRGHAVMLVEFVQAWAVLLDTEMYVTSLADAAPYWMERGYRLEQDSALAHFNTYSDTFLLKLSTNETGSATTDYLGPAAQPDGSSDNEDDDDDENEDDE
jgi:GNAT superfamily N-acetyltransferase